MQVKRCPPGVFCIENVSLTIMIIAAVALWVYFLKPVNADSMYNESHHMQHHMQHQTQHHMQHQTQHQMQQTHPSMFQARANYGVSNAQGDVLLNPYVPPLRDDRATLDVRGPVVPINVSTQGVANAEYRQVGILTRISGPETILPLMGRPLFRNRDKWQFYTISEKNNFIKLPVSVKGRSCTNEYGCDNVYNGDTVYVEGYNDAFKVTAYENTVMQYLPV
jgi:hypothetical protein